MRAAAFDRDRGLHLWRSLSPLAIPATFSDSCHLDAERDRGRPLAVAPECVSPHFFNKPLPKEARNLYFDRACGRECSDVARFELPTASAEAIMAEDVGEPITALTRWDRAYFDRQLRLWPKPSLQAEDGKRAYRGAEGMLFHLYLVEMGDRTRVYLFSITM